MYLQIEFAHGGREVIQAAGEISCRLLKYFADLLRLNCTEIIDDESYPVGITLADSDCPETGEWEPWTGEVRFAGKVFWLPSEWRWHFQIFPEFEMKYWCRVVERLEYLVIYRRLMCHQDAVIVHGALLQLPEQSAGVILFGESGIGKSTLARRFVSQGGSVLSDDKMLLCRLPDGSFRAQPLPTWSRLNSEDISVDFQPAVPVAGFMKLTRGTDDVIVPTDAIQWRLWLASSLSVTFRKPVGWIPPEVIGKIMAAAMDFIPHIQMKFGCLEMQGDLNGHARKHLQDWLGQKDS